MEPEKHFPVAKMPKQSSHSLFSQTKVENLLSKLFHCFTEEVLITWLQM